MVFTLVQIGVNGLTLTVGPLINVNVTLEGGPGQAPPAVSVRVSVPPRLSAAVGVYVEVKELILLYCEAVPPDQVALVPVPCNEIGKSVRQIVLLGPALTLVTPVKLTLIESV